ncbi:MAG: DUF4339 domain-containing protein, partial [Candidatus Lindowbacteria bacterium]|nr:DUF4339 domain-containing protein [Candidatus Lindowbacteria bacterium]
MQKFYIANNGEAIGPVNMKETNSLFEQGKFDFSSWVWDDDSSDWIAATKHPVLSKALKAKFSDQKIDPVLVREYAELQTKKDKISQEVQHARAQLDQANSKIHKEETDRRRVLTELDKTIDTKEIQVKELQNQLDSSNTKKLDDQTLDLEQVSKLAKEREALRLAIKDLLSERADLRQLINDESVINSKLIAEAEKLEARNKNARIAREDLILQKEQSVGETKKLESAVSQLRSVQNDLNGQIENMKSELNSLGDLHVEVAALTDEKSDLECQIGEMQLEIGGIGAQKEDQSIELEVAQAKLKEVKNELKLYEKTRSEEKNTMGSELSHLRSVHNDLNVQIEDMKTELNSLGDLHVEVEKLHQEKNNLETQIGKIQEEIGGVAARKEDQSFEYETAQSRLEEVKAELIDLEKTREEARAVLGADVSQSFGQIKAILGNLKEVSAEWWSARDEQESDQNHKLEALDEAIRRVEKREQEMDNLFGKLKNESEVEGHTALVQAEAQSLERRINAYQEELDVLQGLCNVESSRLETYRSERNQVHGEIENLSFQTEALEAKKASVQDEIDQFAAKRETTLLEKQKFQNEIEALKQEKQVHISAIEDIKELRSEAIHNYLDEERKSSSLNKQLIDLQGRLEILSDEETRLATANRDARRDSDQLTAEISQLNVEKNKLEVRFEELGSIEQRLLKAEERMTHLNDESIKTEESKKAAEKGLSTVVSKVVQASARVEELEAKEELLQQRVGDQEIQFESLASACRQVESDKLHLMKEKSEMIEAAQVAQLEAEAGLQVSLSELAESQTELENLRTVIRSAVGQKEHVEAQTVKLGAEQKALIDQDRELALRVSTNDKIVKELSLELDQKTGLI